MDIGGAGGGVVGAYAHNTLCSSPSTNSEADSDSEDSSVNSCGTSGEHRTLTVTLDADLI